MRQPNIPTQAHGLPQPILELCAHLEERGIHTLSQGESLLHDLGLGPDGVGDDVGDVGDAGAGRAGGATRSLLCLAEPQDVLRALPRAVVTGEGASRLTQASAAGPVDILPAGTAEATESLLSFGLGPLCIGFRPANESWCDPADQLRALGERRLELSRADPNPFVVAPRRYWIAARLIAEYGLEPSSELLGAARGAFQEIAERLPQAAPARRELVRVLAAPHPGPALAFLRESGVSPFLVPGTNPANEARIEALPPLPAVRWAAWLRGSATSSALVRLRVPHALARRIERIQGTHPIERSVENARDLGIRKLLQRHDPDEIAALFAWRRLELAATKTADEARQGEARLADIEARIEAAKTAEAHTDRVRALAFDGRSVMTSLGAGPGRHVGQALAHLARFVADHPEANEPVALEAELHDWARENTNLLD